MILQKIDFFLNSTYQFNVARGPGPTKLQILQITFFGVEWREGMQDGGGFDSKLKTLL